MYGNQGGVQSCYLVLSQSITWCDTFVTSIVGLWELGFGLINLLGQGQSRDKTGDPNRPQVFAEAICVQNERLASHRPPQPVHHRQEANVIEDFVSLLITGDLLSADSVDDLASHEQDIIIDYCLLTSLNPHRFFCPQSFDLSKAPESYYEAIA